MINPTETKSWKKLKELADCDYPLTEFEAEFEGIYLNYSRNNIDRNILNNLINLAKESGLKNEIEQMFSGEPINQTENRAVLHTALRNDKNTNPEVLVNGENVIPWVIQELHHVETFTSEVLNGQFKGFTEKKITDVVNIGIGGSDLGPRMVYRALTPYHNELNIHYVSNVDGNDLRFCLEKLDPETTLFVIVSKTFTTIETMTNAYSARKWLLEEMKDEKAIEKHFVAVSTNEKGVRSFGINEKNIFSFWDWVGGRYSLWSTVGLSISLGVGYDNFEQLLKGAHAMDNHFRNTGFEQNLPVLLGLIGIWNVNFQNMNNQAVIAYNELLNLLVPFLQQLDMESNGKSVDRNGKKINYSTGPIIWGGAGTNVQHSFFQHIHQGTEKVPLDFIGIAKNDSLSEDHNRILLSNMLAQAKSLYEGNIGNEDFHTGRENLKPWRIFEGKTYSNILLLKDLDPYNLGSLIALYEHKVFVQGIIWNIFSFDQWGVELGKVNAKEIEKAWQQTNISPDKVTGRVLEKIRKNEKSFGP